MIYPPTYESDRPFGIRAGLAYWAMLPPLLALGIYWYGIEKAGRWLKRRPKAMRIAKAFRPLPLTLISF